MRRQRRADHRCQQPEPRTLAVDVAASRRLGPAFRGCRRRESGPRSADLEELASLGYRAFLIGERFMTAASPAAEPWSCWGTAMTPEHGEDLRITRPVDALHAVREGATAPDCLNGPESRAISPQDAQESSRPCRRDGTVGVFVNEPPKRS